MLSDLQLISRVKEQHDSEAALALVDRHTGIYFNIIERYSSFLDFQRKTNVNDLKDDKTLNIYKWALTYDPNRGMKFGSYVGKMTEFMCKNLVSDNKETTELLDEVIPSTDEGVIETVERESALDEIDLEVAETDDARFRQIFSLRHGKNALSWREIGQAIHMTHEGARKLYLKHIGAIKEHVVT